MDRNNLKFTASANPEAEALLRKALEGIRSDIAAHNLRGLAGVYLGGGYGRGEGGVFCKNGTVRLYNDLDFFPVGTGLGKTDKAHIDSALREVSRKWHAELGIDVDFGPVKNSSELKRSARTLMFQELRHGFVTICGSDDALAGAVPVLAPEQLPLMEAVRLMLNRGMGLLFAGEKLASHSGDTGFILRNWNKCILGCGDAFLIADKGYLWHVEERRERLLELARTGVFPRRTAELYAQAVAFKTAPHDRMPADPAAHWCELRELWNSTLLRLTGAHSPGELRRALHTLAQREDACGWKQLLRWILRTRTLEPAPMFRDDPLVCVIAELHDALNSAPLYPPCPKRLYHAWQNFN